MLANSLNNLVSAEKEEKRQLDSFNAPNGFWTQSFKTSSIFSTLFKEHHIGYLQFSVRKTTGIYFLEDEHGKQLFEMSEEIAKYIIVGIVAENSYRKKFGNKKVPPFTSETFSKNLTHRLYELFNCHKTLAAILGITIQHDEFYNGWRVNGLNRIAFRKEDYINFSSFSESLTSEIVMGKNELPIVCRIFADNYIQDSPLHSFIILGRTNEGRFICFEKFGVTAMPARLVDLEEIYSTYSKRFFGCKSYKDTLLEIGDLNIKN